MSLRDRLLALLRGPDYTPANEFELGRRLNLNKRDRGALAHEVRLILKDGDYFRTGKGRIARSGDNAEPRHVEQRKIFTPTRRTGAPVPTGGAPSQQGGPTAATSVPAKPIPTGAPARGTRSRAPFAGTNVSPATTPLEKKTGNVTADPAAAAGKKRKPTLGARGPARPEKPTPRGDKPAKTSAGLDTSAGANASASAPVFASEGRAFFTPKARAGAATGAGAATSAPAPASPPRPAVEPIDASRETPARPKLKTHELIGRIQFRAGGSAYIVPENSGGDRSADIQVFPEDTGVALPGDTVLARIFPGRKGRRPGEKIGMVVRVLDRERDTIVGELRKGRRGAVVQPDDPRFSYEIQVGDPAKSGLQPVPKEGDKVVVKLGDWARRDAPLTGTITSRLGRTHEPRAELLGIFLKYNLATEFPADVEREAAAIPDRVQARELVGRLDYRQIPVFTIDPDDAKDFDDALSYETLAGGDIKIGIHIADVSTYVKPGTALDREAQRRGNSTYLVGVVVPMLPEKLSNGLCSLVEAQDRLCKAVFLTFGKNGKLKATDYANTVIRSRKRLTYKQAYAFMFEDDFAKIRALPLPPKHQTGSTGRALRDLSDGEMRDLQTWIRAMWKIAKRLREDRMAHGSLDLDMPETKIFVDEKGYADRLEKIGHDESHQLIEEFMLAANEAVARLTRTHKLASLYRVHDAPDVEKLEELRGLLGTFGIQAGDLTHREELVKLLKVLDKHPQGYTLRTQLLRSLKKAVYRHTPDGHFGLHKKDYTHFTSPIRRYSDLVVHRVFDYYLAKHGGQTGRDVTGYDLPRVERMGEHLSLTEVNSAEAERDSVKVKLLEFFERELEKRPPTKFRAIITDVRANGFFIELLESMTFGFVAAAALGDDYYTQSADGNALVGRKRKRRFTLNDRLDLVVDKVDRYKRLIDFRPA